jgi:hypothetical protein
MEFQEEALVFCIGAIIFSKGSKMVAYIVFQTQLITFNKIVIYQVYLCISLSIKIVQK